MIGDTIALIEFLKKNIKKHSVKSALFNCNGQLKEGDSFIEIVRINTNKNCIWFYKIKEKKDYVFIYMPVIPSLYIDYGMQSGTKNPDSTIFRFVSSPMAKFTSGGESNVISDFIVVAYKPKDLLNLKEDMN